MRLEARDLTVQAGGRALVDGVSLRLRPGEVTVLVGPNGAGKSTLLAALSGHRRADAGTVSLGDRRLADWPPRLLARQRAVLTQDSDLAFAFSVAEVVALGRAPFHGLESEAVDRAIVAAAMRLAHVDHLAGRSYPTLSSGERQRVMLARVLAQILEPDGAPAGRWLLLDEPTASLDLAHQKLVMSVAAGLAGQGAGMLVVLHELNLAARFAGRVAMLARGRLVAEGVPQDVLTAERVGRLYGVDVTHTAVDGRPFLALA